MDDWKQLAYEHIQKSLGKYEIREADIDYDYEKKRIDIRVTLNMSIPRDDKRWEK
jgi:hypothetical protein